MHQEGSSLAKCVTFSMIYLYEYWRWIQLRHVLYCITLNRAGHTNVPLVIRYQFDEHVFFMYAQRLSYSE